MTIPWLSLTTTPTPTVPCASFIAPSQLTLNQSLGGGLQSVPLVAVMSFLFSCMLTPPGSPCSNRALSSTSLRIFFGGQNSWLKRRWSEKGLLVSSSSTWVVCISQVRCLHGW
ncbi:hypothetical protein I3843_15G066800 [Carya illinoinensis]|nr:hypothetical protein I3843_15G066800 [Carya illinoinensis]